MAPSAAKVALITGGSKGIGAAAARALRSQGWTVVVTYSSDGGAAEKLVQELGADAARAIKSDASRVADIDPLLEQVLAAYGRLDAVVASAGVLPDVMPQDVTEAAWDRCHDLNAKGVFFLVQVRGLDPARSALTRLFREGRLADRKGYRKPSRT